MGDAEVRLDPEGVARACGLFEATADACEGLVTAGLDNGIVVALEGGTAGAACADAAEGARVSLAALARRSRTLAGAARSVVATLEATDDDFARALDGVTHRFGEGR